MSRKPIVDFSFQQFFLPKLTMHWWKSNDVVARYKTQNQFKKHLWHLLQKKKKKCLSIKSLVWMSRQIDRHFKHSLLWCYFAFNSILHNVLTCKSDQMWKKNPQSTSLHLFSLEISSTLHCEIPYCAQCTLHRTIYCRNSMKECYSEHSQCLTEPHVYWTSVTCSRSHLN